LSSAPSHFEPRLLARGVTCFLGAATLRPCTREFRPVPSLTSFNGAQPEVAILSVTSDWDPIHDRPLAALILWSR